MDEYLRLTPSPSGAVSERMQALLSRAVEDQVNEQREVQSLLNEVKNALAEVQRDTRISPAGDADLRAELANHSSETRVQLTLLDERLEALVRAVSTSAQVLQGLSGQLERVNEAVRDRSAEAVRTEPIAQVRHEVADLRTQVGGMEALLHSEISTLGERFTSEVEALRDMSGSITQAVTDHVDNAVLVLAEALLRRPGPAADEAAESGSEMQTEPEDLLATAPVPEEPAAAEPETVEPATVDEAVVEPEVVEEAAVEEVEEPPADEPTPASGPALGPNLALVESTHTAESYDDVLSEIPESEIPESDEGSVFPQFRQAPYDLERSLFGDRSRVFVAAETAAEGDVEPDVSAGSPPEDVAEPDVAEADVAEPDVAQPDVAQPDVEDTVRRGDYVAYEEEDVAPAEDDEDDEDEAPRRRPWWRPTN